MWPTPRPMVRTTSELLAHFQVEPTVWEGFQAAVGTIGEDLRPLASIPAAVMAAAIEEARTPAGHALTIMEASQVGLIYRAAKRGTLLEGWRRPYGLGGPGSMGRNHSWYCSELRGPGDLYDYGPFDFKREEDEVREYPGPRGRNGVLHGGRRFESPVDPALLGDGGGTPGRDGGTYAGATLSLAQTPDERWSTFRRLCGLHSIQQEVAESHEVQDMDTERRGRLHGEGNTRSSKLPPVAHVLQGLQDGDGDVGRDQPGPPALLRGGHGTAQRPLSHLLAPAHLCGREGPLGASGEDEVEGHDGNGSRRATAKGLGPAEALERALQAAGRRLGLLAGASSHAGHGVDLQGREGHREDSSREDGAQLLHRRDPGHRGGNRGPDEGEPGRRRRNVEAAERSGQAFGQEEAACGGARRTTPASGSTRWRWRFKRRQRQRRWERRERKRRRAAVLRLEQQQWPLCRAGSGPDVQSQCEAGAQVYGVQEPGAQIPELPEEQRVVGTMEIPILLAVGEVTKGGSRGLAGRLEGRSHRSGWRRWRRRSPAARRRRRTPKQFGLRRRSRARKGGQPGGCQGQARLDRHLQVGQEVTLRASLQRGL